MKFFIPIIILYSFACSASANINIENKFIENTERVKINQDESSIIRLFGKPEAGAINHDIDFFKTNKKIEYIYNYPSPITNLYHYVSIAIHKKKVTAFQMCYTYMAAPGAFAEKCMPVKDFWLRYKANKL